MAYTYDEAYKATLSYFEGDELATDVFLKKYALTDYDGNLLEKTPDQMHRRIAKEFARVERNKFKVPMTEDDIYKYLDRFKYIVPQGSPMAGIGNKFSYQTLGNCYVINSPYDSIGSICYTDQQISQLMKRRAGVGFDISNIRPKGLVVNNSAKTTDGIAVFMEKFSSTCREIAQGGRRGALLQSINVHHPEVETFINIKKDLKKATGANISVKLSDDFLKAVEKNEDYEQYWPLDGSEKKISKMVNARKIWEQIIDNAWLTGEPGVMFFDTMIKNSISNPYGKINENFYDKSTNPCGEIIMGVDSCRLMILPLYNFVENPFTENAKFNFNKFGESVEVAQRLMDDMIDLEIECINRIISKIRNDKEPNNIKLVELETWKNIKKICELGRRTGLGVNALADCLASLNLKYDSKEAMKVTDKIFEKFAVHSMKSSCIMAKELGSFPLFNKDIEKNMNSPLLNRIFQTSDEVKKLHEKYGRRNISLTTCSPTGTVSLLTQTSSGIEPLFMMSYKRRRKLNSNEDKTPSFVDDLGDKWIEYDVLHKPLLKWIDVAGNDNVEASPYFGSTTDSINWEKSVEMQSVVQKWITHSISKTVNAPNDITKDITEQVYMKAWKSGCKGITFYRDGSRSGVLVNKTEQTDNKAKKRPKELECEIYHTQVTKRLDKVRTFKYMVMIGVLDNYPYELFAIENGQYNKYDHGKIIKVKKGHYDLIFDDNEKLEDFIKETTESEDALTRMVSISLRHKVPLSFICDQLNKVEGDLFCFAKALARSLKKYIKDGEKSGENCSKCGSKLIYENGCYICKSCGESRCS